MIKLLNEVKNSVSDAFSDVFKKIRELDTRFNNIDDKAISNLMQVYADEMHIWKAQVNAEDFVDWFNLSDTIGDFVIDYAKKLPTITIYELGKEDQKFINAVVKAAKKWQFIDKNGYEIVDFANNVSKHKPDFKQLCQWIFTDINKRPSQKDLDDAKNLSKEDSKDLSKLSDKDYMDENDRKAVIKEIKNIYIHMNESLNEADEKIKPVPALDKEESNDEEVLPSIEIKDDELEIPEISDSEENIDTKELDAESVKNSLIDLAKGFNTQMWDLISGLNSMISTIKYNGEVVKLNSTKAIIDIIDSIVDDITIDIGMLNKVEMLLDDKSKDLLSQGLVKADKIAKEN